MLGFVSKEKIESGKISLQYIDKNYKIYSRHGIVVNSLEHLSQYEKLFVVPSSDWFMWPGRYL